MAVVQEPIFDGVLAGYDVDIESLLCSLELQAKRTARVCINALSACLFLAT